MKKKKLFSLDEETIDLFKRYALNFKMDESKFFSYVFEVFLKNFDYKNKLKGIENEIKNNKEKNNKLLEEKKKINDLIKHQRSIEKQQNKFYTNKIKEMAKRITLGWDIGVHKDCFNESVRFNKVPAEMFSDALEESKKLNYTEEEKERIKKSYENEE